MHAVERGSIVIFGSVSMFVVDAKVSQRSSCGSVVARALGTATVILVLDPVAAAVEARKVAI